MIFFDEMYVGFQRERYSRDDDPRLLAFAVPYGETKAQKKRIETVDNWSNDKKDSKRIANVPTRGFKLVQVVSRDRTSNKLFRILDPRGFELEITSENLLSIAKTSTIVQGEIIEECVWAQQGTINLCPTSNEHYKHNIAMKDKPKAKIEAGGYYVSVGNAISIFRFEGILHHTFLEDTTTPTKGEFDDVKFDSRDRFGYNKKNEFRISELTTNVKILMNSGKKPSYLYTEFIINDDGEVTRTTVHLRKGHFKNMEDYTGVVTKEIAEMVFDPFHWINSQAKGDVKLDYITGYNESQAFFKTKADAIAFDYSEIISNIDFNYKASRSYRMNLDDCVGYTSGYYSGYSGYNYRTNTSINNDAINTVVISDERVAKK